MVRFYINGTAGSQDGTEVTADNPIVADGMFPSGSTPATKPSVYLFEQMQEKVIQAY